MFIKKGSDEEPIEFMTREEKVIDHLDKAIMNMKKGEVVLVTIVPKYGYGIEVKIDLVVVPPQYTLIYKVELVSFVKERESWDMKTPKKIEATRNKEREIHYSRL